MNKIITIGREFGSGGRELGKTLAELLGYAYYDGEIVTAIAEKSELAVEYVNQVLEKRIMTYYPTTVGNTFAAMPGDSLYSINRSIYAAQTEIIQEMAAKSDCVIVGRCSDHILAEYKPLRVFVYADMASKMTRCREKGEDGQGLSDKELERNIKAVDRARSQYYRFYTGDNWGDITNYDIMLNTSGQSIRAAAEAVAALARARQG